MKKIFVLLFLLCTQLFAQGELKLLTTIHGENEGDEFSDVDAIGDINGDRFDDFIIGKKNRGSYLKLYFGGSPFDTLNCIKFLEGARKRVYASGCGKGDLNGDGFNDFVINTLYDVNDYRVEIYYGGKDKKIYDNPDLIITNNGWYYGFGARSISGDLNNDGYDDLVITAPNDDFDAHGRLYIYYGGKEIDDVCDVFLEGKEAADMFGNSAEIIGDVNADGYDDLLVGAPQDLKGEGGKAYLFFGGDSIGFNNAIELIGDTTKSYNSYGRIVSGLGDINCDGFDDFGVMSIEYIDIFLGKTFEVLSKINSYYEFWNVNGYDVNKDNYSDFIISYARQDDQYVGGIALYFGGNELDTVNVLTLNGNTKNSYFGNRLAIGGDINGDGLPEIFIGEDGELTQIGTRGSGTVYIYSYGKPNGIKDREEFTLPFNYELFPNYPNPFNPSTTIQYKLNKVLSVRIDVYDIFGRKIKKIFEGVQQPGSYTATWDSTNEKNEKAASGVYFLSFTAKPTANNRAIQREVIKMILMR